MLQPSVTCLGDGIPMQHSYVWPSPPSPPNYRTTCRVVCCVGYSVNAALGVTQTTKAFTYMTNLVSHIIVYRLISCFPISPSPRWSDKTKPLSFHKLPWANTYNTTDILYFVLRCSLFSQIMRRGGKKKSCWSIRSVFLCCNGWSGEGSVCVYWDRIHHIELVVPLIVPRPEKRKVQAGLQRRRMTDSRHVIEHARSMLPLTSLCNMSLPTCTQHPSGNSNHIPSQYSDLSGSCHTLWRQAAWWIPLYYSVCVCARNVRFVEVLFQNGCVLLACIMWIPWNSAMQKFNK